MIKELLKKRKYLDFININNNEVLIALALTVLLVIIGVKLDIYENFDDFKLAFQNITIYIAAGLLAMIGVILTGLALILGVLDRRFIKEIGSINKDTVNDLMICFKFLIVNLGFSSVLFFFIHFMLFVKIYITQKIYYLIITLITYYFIFLVFYTVDLISTSIDLYLIKNIAEDTDVIEFDNEKNKLKKYISEIKLEYLMREHDAKSYDKFFSIINEVIDDIRDIDELTKHKLIKVFKEIYDRRKK
jgi:hypothetical protein